MNRVWIPCILLVFPIAVCAQKPKKAVTDLNHANATPIVWKDPGSVSATAMAYGIGSKEDTPQAFPDGTFHFNKEEIKSTFPKIEVKDANGNKFKVKFTNGLDSKSHTEVVNNRLLWAMGFRSREIYYVASGKLDKFIPGDPKNPKLKSKVKGKLKLGSDGKYTFSDVTFTAKDDDTTNKTWSYVDKNLPASIAQSAQFTWLKIFDVLVGNWDPKPDNHTIAYVRNASDVWEAWYQDKDVGTGYGNDHLGTGVLHVRPTRWKLKDYQTNKFVLWDMDRENKEINGGKIHLDYAVSDETPKAKEVRDACSTVSKADAKSFVEQVLNRLSPDIIRAAFFAGGANPLEADGFSKALLARIQQLRVATGAKAP